MKNKIYLLLLFLFSCTHFSQEISKENIQGTWNVVETVGKFPDKSLQKSFQNAIFIFSPNNNFELKTNSKGKLFSEINAMTKNTKWIISDQNLNEIRIGNKKDKYSIMSIQVSLSKKLFYLKETGIVLKVEKK